jgi:hypothetical protein
MFKKGSLAKEKAMNTYQKRQLLAYDTVKGEGSDKCRSFGIY